MQTGGNYVITGKLGAGKTLIAIGEIRKALEAGRPVATNIDIYPYHVLPRRNKNMRLYRLPDTPDVSDLEMIGRARPAHDKNEINNGVIVLDECAHWFNSRQWQQHEKINRHMLYLRKLGWSVFFIIQDISALDKQARKLFCEHVVYCRRTDRIGGFTNKLWQSLTGSESPLFPKIHMGIVRYGDLPHSPIVDRVFYRGADLYHMYDTNQTFGTNDSGTHALIPPYLKQRPPTAKWGKKIMKLTKIYYGRTTTLRQLALAGIAGAGLALAFWPSSQSHAEQADSDTVTIEPLAQIEQSAPTAQPATIQQSDPQPPAYTPPPLSKRLRIAGEIESATTHQVLIEGAGVSFTVPYKGNCYVRESTYLIECRIDGERIRANTGKPAGDQATNLFQN